jgi:DNA-binding MarR family transcriptional regulator
MAISTVKPPGLGGDLVRMSQVIQRTLERRAAGHGSTAAQLQLLELLQERAPTINELAALLELDKSSTSGLVGRAQRRGLVRRVRSQLDRRSVRVRLTDAGRELHARVGAQVADDIAALLEPLTAAERTALAAALGAMLPPRTDGRSSPPRSAGPAPRRSLTSPGDAPDTTKRAAAP